MTILDACRNNPFSAVNKTSGRGLAIVDAPNGSLVSYSTAPGTEALDGDGANSPYTTALLKIGREPGVPSPSDPDALLERFVPAALKQKLEAARTSGEMVGERRIVTMLFCDVKGSTSAAERLDPEEWTEIINGAFEHMIRPIYTYEGTVARLMGDGILAFFGAPLAHEDDPERAVLAGLDIVSGITPYRERIQKLHPERLVAPPYQA